MTRRVDLRRQLVLCCYCHAALCAKGAVDAARRETETEREYRTSRNLSDRLELNGDGSCKQQSFPDSDVASEHRTPASNTVSVKRLDSYAVQSSLAGDRR